MKYVEAPRELKNLEHPVVFLAGGITNCEDWQSIVVEELIKTDSPKGTLLNPRRKNFPIHDPGAAREQILWEHAGLWMADVIAFWFSGGESVQPIAMFEFGCHLGRYCVGAGPRMLIGVDDDYKRREDIIVQLEAHSRTLNGPWKITPVFKLEDHIRNIKSIRL